jgi:PilZ domain
MIERPFSSWVKRNRKPMSLTGVAYRTDGSWMRVHMTDLSYEGCKLLTEDELDIGETLTLVMPRMQHMQAQVRWIKDQTAGVRFLQGASVSSVDSRRARIGV